MQQGLENLGSTQQSEAHAQRKGEAQADDQGELHLHGQQEGQHQGYDHQQQIQRKGSDHHQQDMEVSEGNQMNFKKPDLAPRRSTFWTACPACKMQYEYETIYMNKDLCCPICYAPFFSKEIQPKQGAILYDSAMQQFRKVQTMDSDGSNVSQKLHLNMNVEIGKEHISVQQNCQSSPRVSIGRAKTFSKELHDNLDGKTEDLDELNFRKKCQNMPGLMGSGSMSGNRSSSNLADQINISDLNIQNIPKIGVGFIKKGETILGADVSALGISNIVGSKQIQDSLPTQNGTGTAVQNSPASNDDKRDSRLRTRYSIRNKDLPADSNCSPGSQVSKLKQSTSNNLTVSKKTENVNNIREKSTVGISNFKERIHQVAESQKSRGLQKALYSSELDDSESETLLQKRKEVFPVTDHACDDVPMKKPRQDTKCESFSKFPTDKELEKSLLEKDSGKSCLSIDISSEFNDKYEMEVPDPDFHNFDEDRTENHFAVGQIWSTYDDDDGMPRYYARVDRILSARPLKLQMHWLEARDPSDEIRAWLNAGFQQSCGDFKLGSIYIADGVGTFSHLVNVDKVVKGSFKIYPRKGEVWALYKRWEFLKVKDDKGGYDLIEIVTSFDEKNGVQGTPLLKVAGFKTIFERKDCMMCIPTHEIRRFSHRVPAHFTSAGDLPCINQDCIEIDPASVPLDLVIGEQ
ncbi:hypothetical protein KP509_01G106900 [Ceratopteris richardii]|nr:hypothetical protein KP509_01G106900 [Ceratopteris richardii]